MANTVDVPTVRPAWAGVRGCIGIPVRVLPCHSWIEGRWVAAPRDTPLRCRRQIFALLHWCADQALTRDVLSLVDRCRPRLVGAQPAAGLDFGTDCG
jgi:hypothetical protein